jgi:hypothetical protein
MDPYPDPGGPKTCGSGRSGSGLGSATLYYTACFSLDSASVCDVFRGYSDAVVPLPWTTGVRPCGVSLHRQAHIPYANNFTNLFLYRYLLKKYVRQLIYFFLFCVDFGSGIRDVKKSGYRIGINILSARPFTVVTLFVCLYGQCRRIHPRALRYIAWLCIKRYAARTKKWAFSSNGKSASQLNNLFPFYFIIRLSEPCAEDPVSSFFSPALTF